MGAQVALAARRTDRMAEVEKQIIANSGDDWDTKGHHPLPAASFSLDVTNSDSVIQCFDQVEAAFGRPPDIIINNAGVAVTKHVLKQREGDWDSVVNTNLKVISPSYRYHCLQHIVQTTHRSSV